MSAPGGHPIIKTFHCRCGWHRDWNEDYRGSRHIDHPVYGLVTARDAAIMDIRLHDCAAARNAAIRARKLFGVRKDGYPLAMSNGVTPPVDS